MKHSRLYYLMALSLLTQNVALAQDFPDGSSVPSNEEIRKYLEDRVHDTKIADGTTWRLEYKSSGYYFVNTSRGFNGDGKWQAEDGKLCGQLKGGDRNCSEVRMHKGFLLVKRNNGEIIQINPR